MLALALRGSPPHGVMVTAARGTNAAERIEACFVLLGSCSANAEHRRAIAGLNDRLHAVRLTESGVLADVDTETDRLALAITEDRRTDIRRLVVAYHRRRRRAAAEIVRALYRAPPTFAE